jgi:solute carrier family 25 phosphate transporter 23/24/25/41
MPEKRDLINLFSGATAGVVSRSVTAPLERVKIIKQVRNTGRNMFGDIIHIYSKEGVKSFWKGNGINAVRIAPYNAIQMASFYKYKRLLKIDGEDKYKHSKTFLASSSAGMTSVISCYPLDLVRSAVTIQMENGCGKEKRVRDIIKNIYRKKGIRGFYNGLGASLIGIVPYIGINLYTFDNLKSMFQPHPSHSHFDLYNFGMGSISTTVSVCITYPLEVTRRRLQLSGISGVREYNNYLHCVRSVWRRKGLVGFYQGFIPCFFRIIPAMSIAMLVNERMRSMLND